MNGSTGGDTIVLTNITDDGALVTAAQPVPVTVDTTEHLLINGQGGSDALTYTSPIGADNITFDPGATPGAGAITAFDIGTGNAILHQKDTGNEDSVLLDVDEPVKLGFAARYLNFFSRASGLSSQVTLNMAKETPLMVEYKLHQNTG